MLSIPEDRRCKVTEHKGHAFGPHWAMRGLQVCRMHGPTRAARVKAATREQLQEAARRVTTMGLPEDVGPHEALEQEVRRSAGAVRWLQERIAGLQAEELIWNRAATESTRTQYPKGSVEDTALVRHEARLHGYVEMWHIERRLLVSACKAAIAAGIEERRVRMNEELGGLIAQVLRDVILDPQLGLGDEQREAAFDIVAQRLRLLPSVA